MNDYGQLAFREDYRRRLSDLRRRMTEKHQKKDVRCIFEEVRASVEWISGLPARETACLKEHEVDAMILFKRYLREHAND